MATARILVVGATGTVGSSLVGHLVRSGHGVRILARDPRRAASRLGPGVEIAAGDLRDPASLDAALAGIECASLATAPSPRLHEEEGNFIEAARAAGLRRLVKLSAFGLDFARDRIHRAHVASEHRLRESGLASVVLRPVIFMSNTLMEAEAIKLGRLPSAFGEARVNFVDPRDVAELMARALVEAQHEGQAWELGGPEPLDHDELAAVLSDVLGRRVQHVPLGPREFRDSATRSGLPDFVIEAIVDAASAAREGRYLVDDQVIRRVLGRRGSTFRQWAERNQEAFA